MKTNKNTKTVIQGRPSYKIVDIKFYGIQDRTSIDSKSTSKMLLDIHDVSVAYELTMTDDNKLDFDCTFIELKNGIQIYAETKLDVLHKICEVRDNNEMLEVLYK